MIPPSWSTKKMRAVQKLPTISTISFMMLLADCSESCRSPRHGLMNSCRITPDNEFNAVDIVLKKMFKKLFLSCKIILIPEGGAENSSNKKPREAWYLYGEVHHSKWNNLVHFPDRLKGETINIFKSAFFITLEISRCLTIMDRNENKNYLLIVKSHKNI